MKRKNQIMLLFNIILMLTGIMSLFFKAVAPEYIDNSGILHEYFFLLPIGYGCIFSSMVLFVIWAIIRKIR